MSLDTTIIVLAGGVSRRLGRDKAVEEVGGQPLIRRVLGRLAQVDAETVVVVNNADRVQDLPLPDGTQIVIDLFPRGGALGGIYTGLKSARNGWVIVVACDMPFLNVALLKYISSQRGGVDVVVPLVGGFTEPIHAAYSKACLPIMERRLRTNDLKITGFFDQVRVRYIEGEEIERFDPEHLSFFNVNTEQDLASANQLAFLSTG
jgi:molybdopterin-guanine dinucleotide biosynthesis protein A